MSCTEMHFYHYGKITFYGLHIQYVYSNHTFHITIVLWFLFFTFMFFHHLGKQLMTYLL